jgi:putative ABC transport system permease protein
MFKNYFLTGIRSLLKEKGFSAVKIIGLAFGLAASLMIYLYVQEDLSFDRFHADNEKIYRVLTIDKAEGVSSKHVGVTPAPLGPAVKEELPEVVNAVRMQSQGKLNLSYEDKLLRCDACFRTESSFFEIFNFPILEGKKEGVLDEPNTIAITETLAHRIFGDENPIGKSIKLNQDLDLYVVALVADPPKNSHIQFDLLRSMTPGQDETNYAQNLLSWGGLSQFTYLKFDREVDREEVDAKIQALARKNNLVEFFVPTVQPLNDVHLGSKEIIFESNFNKSDYQNVYILSLISLLILVLAIINFSNLVTAKSTSRAKEVGIRKLVVMVAAVLALAMITLLVPTLNTVYNRFAEIGNLWEWQNLLLIVGIVLLTGIIAGLYPAFVLSSFKPLKVLSGTFKNSATGSHLRKGLVVFQFTISIALIIGTAIVYQQMNFIFSTDLGYSRDQILTLQGVPNSGTLKNELLRHQNIKAAGTSTTQLGQQFPRTGVSPEGFPEETPFIVTAMAVDETFIPTMDMSILEGRNFSLDYNDSTSVIINEEMAKLFDWEDPIGRKLGLGGEQPYTVVGMVKNFHFATIRHQVEPLYMQFSGQNGNMAVKIEGQNIPQTLEHIEATWQQVNPEVPFEYNFLDAQFENLYRNDRAFATMFFHFALLAVLIACLGLFALSTFMVEQREKEISIRKVLGASLGRIWLNLSLEFVLLVGVAFLLASIISYFVMNQWLQDFQYRIEIGITLFLLAGIISIAIALFTISFQTLKATFKNPVGALKGE